MAEGMLGWEESWKGREREAPIKEGALIEAQEGLVLLQAAGGQEVIPKEQEGTQWEEALLVQND
jgi:hypothetical protein